MSDLEDLEDLDFGIQTKNTVAKQSTTLGKYNPSSFNDPDLDLDELDNELGGGGFTKPKNLDSSSKGGFSNIHRGITSVQNTRPPKGLGGSPDDDD